MFSTLRHLLEHYGEHSRGIVWAHNSHIGDSNATDMNRRGDDELLHLLRPHRLQRAIGVIYRPDTERASHYYHASLPRQFDEYIWFDGSRAVTPLAAKSLKGLPDTYPFGL